MIACDDIVNRNIANKDLQLNYSYGDAVLLIPDNNAIMYTPIFMTKCKKNENQFDGQMDYKAMTRIP